MNHMNLKNYCLSLTKDPASNFEKTAKACFFEFFQSQTAAVSLK